MKENSISSERNIYLDNAKAVLILLVVLGHFVEACLEGSNVAKSIFLFIYAFHIPLFLFLSGISCGKVISQYDKTASKIVFYLWLYVIYKACIFFIKIYFDGKASFHLFTEGGIPWYLFAMALYYIMAYLIKNIIIIRWGG